MVGWFNPLQLARTGIDVAVSTIFGSHSDYRIIEALSATSDEPLFFDHSSIEGEDGAQQRDEIWIDYIGDTGDGWNSTYAIAYWLTQKLPASNPAGPGQIETKPGELLIFGGDQVYPTATRARYRKRLVAPFTTARQWSDPPVPYLFAIPGNHDWYDSLVSFSRLFCQRRTFAGWQTQQQRSYFAIKLPHHWWLLGIDVQLHSDLDSPQVSYFKRVCEEMQPGDKVILCTAEPHWVEAAMYQRQDPDINENNLRFLEERILAKVDVKVFIAGDLHHYRRHRDEHATQHKITSGGGGAFLHPTHGEDVSIIGDKTDPFTLAKEFPDSATSKRLCWRNLLFPLLNPGFGLLTGLLYLAIAWGTRTNLLGRPHAGFSGALREILRGSLAHPVWVAAALFGFVFFTDTHSRLYKWIGGLAHAIAHLVAAFILAWFAAYLCQRWGLNFIRIRARLITLGIVFPGGWILGSFIMGLYLLISLNVFRRHSNEAFSALAIPDYKNFLRMHIDPAGKLAIFPFGIRRVPRKWKQPSQISLTNPKLEADDPRATSPHPIEDPIVVT